MRRNVIIRLTIAFVLLIIALLLTRAPRALGTRVAWIGMIQRPVSAAVIGVTTWFNAIGQVLRNPERLIVLETEVAALRASRASMERGLLEARNLLTERGVVYPRRLGTPRQAHVVAATFTPNAQTITVEVEIGDPIGIGQPVAAQGTLIGTIVASGMTRAIIQLLGDPRTRLAVELAGTAGTLGILEADPGGGLIVTKIPADQSIAPGASVVSGLLHARVPPGMPIGVITEVRRDPDGFFQTAAVDPIVDPRRQTDVTIFSGVYPELETKDSTP